ncbi:MAG: hypothetical protein ACYTGB_20105, partial [Planctomycetota bacterium]
MSTSARNPLFRRLIQLAALAALAAMAAPHVGAGVAPAGGEDRLADLEVTGLLAGPESPWEVKLPDDNRREVALRGDVFGGRLRLAVRLAENPGATAVRLSVYLINKNGWFYKTSEDYLLTHRRPVEIDVDLGPDSAQLVPSGSARPWSEVSGIAMRRLGLALFGTGPYTGGVQVTAASISGGSREEAVNLPGPGVEALEVLPASPGAGDLVDLAFRFPVAFVNPFDPDVADIAARIAGPGDLRMTVPAYYDQAFVPVREGFELRAVPVGPGRWKVRFLARARGEYKVALFYRGEKFADLLVPVGPARPRRSVGGLVRTDSEYLEKLATVGGESLLRRLPPDAGRGLCVWKDGGFAPVGPAAGASAGWIAPLEWTSEWGRWLGLGRYNLEAAWKLDVALDRAARIGVRRPLLLNFDGMFMTGGRHPLDRREHFGGRYLQSGRYRWAFNPLSSRLGGPLVGPGQYFSNPGAEKTSRALFRYLAARYGQHPAVDGLVLGASFPAEGASGWHERVGGYLAACFDPGGGLKLRSFHPGAVEFRERTLIGTFEDRMIPEGWRFDREVCPRAEGGYSSAVKSHGRQSLRIDADFPGEVFCLLRSVDMSCGRYQALTFDTYLPPETPRDIHVRAMVYLRDRELNWYETLLPGELRSGDWTRFSVDLRPGRS